MTTELHVEVAGAGEPIVALHGFTGSTVAMAGLTERLASDFRVIAVDLVGHGRSPVPDDVDAYTVDAMARDVAAVIEQRAGGSANVVGYSMGGRVALSVATAAPEAVRSLTVIGASAGLADPQAAVARRAADERLASSIETDGLAAFVDRWMDLPMWTSLEAALGPDGWEASRRQRLENDPGGLALSLRGMGAGAQPPVHDLLAAFDRPALVMAGELDTKFAAVARELATELPDARVQLVPGAGHAAHAERPTEVVRSIADFLDAVDG